MTSVIWHRAQRLGIGQNASPTRSPRRPRDLAIANPRLLAPYTAEYMIDELFCGSVRLPRREVPRRAAPAANDVSCKSLEINTNYFPRPRTTKTACHGCAPRDLAPAQALARYNQRV